jgi:mRNA (guanine-N7-)-methyltransferase
LASEYNLELKYHKEFHDIFDEFNDHSEFGPLMQRMKVVNSDGGSQMDEFQWEAASEFLTSSLRTNSLTPPSDIYVAFVFEKR